ncbi:MAG: C1 family peptidase [Planctomycetota bacterium]
MSAPRRLEFGWSPDVPDFRDITCYAQPFSDATQTHVDLRDEGLEFHAVTCEGSDATCSIAVLAMIDWQSRRWAGTPVDASASFVHHLTTTTEGGGGVRGVSLRSTVKTLLQFGAPPERLWPTQPRQLKEVPRRPELFGYSKQFEQLRYLRLDAWTFDQQARLSSIRRWLAQGNPCVLGFAVPTTLMIEDSASIPFDVDRGGTAGGSACVAVGYNDHFELRKSVNHPLIRPESRSRGAILIRTCWGSDWGESGYGWLPYAFVESRFACDAWAIIHPEWRDWEHGGFA